MTSRSPGPEIDRDFDRLTASESESSLMRRLEDLAKDPRADGPVPAPRFPLKLQIQTHTACNAACVMCPHPVTSKELPGGRMSVELHERILAEAARHPVQRISHFLMNEPLLDRRLSEWIRRTREVVPQATTALFSNGDRLDEDLLLALADAGLGELSISLNGGDVETFERVNVGLSFERIASNLERAVALGEAGRLGGLRIQVVAIDLPEVRSTFERLRSRFEGESVRVFLRPVTNRAGNVQTGPAGVSGSASGRRVCQRPFVKAYILFNGDVVLCNCDWRREVVLGNVLERSLEDIWRSASYTEIRRRQIQLRFEAGSICERCDYPWGPA